MKQNYGLSRANSSYIVHARQIKNEQTFKRQTHHAFYTRLNPNNDLYWQPRGFEERPISNLALEQIDLLVPTNEGKYIIMTRHPDLTSGDYLRDVGVNAFIMDRRLLGLPEELLTEHGGGTIIVKAEA